MRSRDSRSRSTSAVIRCDSFEKRSDSASSSPFSYAIAWPSHARSVVGSAGPADESRYAAMQRADCDWTSWWRYHDLPIVMLDADRLTSPAAPASAAYDDGGIGTHTSSQISTWTQKFGR